MEAFKAFLELVAATFGPQITAILGLTLAQVVLAVAVALKEGSFELKKLADFFTKLIIPKLLGWLACAILAQFVLPDYLPGELGPGVAMVAFLAVVASFVGSILESLQALGILPAQASGLLAKIGVENRGAMAALENKSGNAAT